MGIFKLVKNISKVTTDSVNSEFADQYLEAFHCDSLGNDVLLRMGVMQNTTGNNMASPDVISNGSKVVVPEGTAALFVDNGRVMDEWTTPGMLTITKSSSPSILANGNVTENAKAVVGDIWERMRFAGEVATQQRIYYVNMLEILEPNFSIELTVPYCDPVYKNIYLNIQFSYTYRVTEPATFFRNVTGAVRDGYTTYDLMGTDEDPKQPYYELVDHIGEAFNLLGSKDKIPFAELSSHKSDIKKRVVQALNEVWTKKRGISIASISISAVNPILSSKNRVAQYDQASIFAEDPKALAAEAVLGTTKAMNTSAENHGGIAGVMTAGILSNASGEALKQFQEIQKNEGPKTVVCKKCHTVFYGEEKLEFCKQCGCKL